MHKRGVVVAIMILFLLVGTVSSFACDMMCMPGMQKASCCGRTTAHCAGLASISDARQCAHPQQESAIATTATQALQLYMAVDADKALTAHLSIAANAAGMSPRHSPGQFSFTPPLRI